MVDSPVRHPRFSHRDTSLVRCRVPRRCVARILTLATMASPDQDPGTKSRPAEPPRLRANRRPAFRPGLRSANDLRSQRASLTCPGCRSSLKGAAPAAAWGGVVPSRRGIASLMLGAQIFSGCTGRRLNRLGERPIDRSIASDIATAWLPQTSRSANRLSARYILGGSAVSQSAPPPRARRGRIGNGSPPPAVRIRCGRRSATGRGHDEGTQGSNQDGQITLGARTEGQT